VHSAGYVYNDLKLDNLMIGFQESLNPDKELTSTSLHMVDFGFSSRYIDSQTHEHIEQGEVETF
jgi:serine/threonine protein kinase